MGEDVIRVIEELGAVRAKVVNANVYFGHQPIRDALLRVHALLDVCFLALVHTAWSTLHQDLRRPFIALDAGRTHHTILARWRDLPKGGTMRVTTREGFAEILTPDAGSNVALRLDVHEIPMRLIEAIRHWRSWHGLRHWAALQRLLTRAGRTGRIRWTLNDHMDALGLSARAYHRVLRVARTAADLAGSDGIDAEHLSEAIQYRRFRA